MRAQPFDKAWEEKKLCRCGDYNAETFPASSGKTENNHQSCGRGVLAPVSRLTRIATAFGDGQSAGEDFMAVLKLAAYAAAALAVAGAAQAECVVTKAQYSALQSGMTEADAVSVLGCAGEEMSSSDIGGIRTVMYMWKGESLGANMNAMFQDDRLVTKAQFGLR